MANIPKILTTEYRSSLHSAPNENPIKYHSFSGADMVAMIRIDDEYYDFDAEVKSPAYKVFAELQTISVSGTRSVHPVRRLGESQPKTYTRGARTIAGTLVFAMFSRDVFADIYRLNPHGEVFSPSEPFFLDQIPEFDIVVTAVNEHGVVSRALIGGITLTNYGTTLSIHDIYTEASYSYVARMYLPMTEDIKNIDKTRQLVYEDKGRTASNEARRLLRKVPSSIQFPGYKSMTWDE